MNAIFTSVLLFIGALTPTSQAGAAIDVSKNHQFLDWLVEQKIPTVYQPLFKLAQVPQDKAQVATTQLLSYHKKCQKLRLQINWDRTQNKPAPSNTEAKQLFENLRLKIRAELHQTLGDDLYLAFRKAESSQRLKQLSHELDRNTRAGGHPGLEEAQRLIVRKLFTKHLLKDGILLEDTQSAYPAMITEAQTQLSANGLKFFNQRFKDEQSWAVLIYRPLTLTPSYLTSLRF